MHPYSSIDTTSAWKKLRFILSVRSDFHMIDRLSIAVHAFVSRVSMSFSVDETLLTIHNFPSCEFCRSYWPKSEKKLRRWRNTSTFSVNWKKNNCGTWSPSDINCNWCTWNRVQRTWKIDRRNWKSVEESKPFRLQHCWDQDRILRRVLEAWALAGGENHTRSEIIINNTVIIWNR